MKCDAVFEGGGVNGIAFCGAVMEMVNAGYEFNRCAGTSAGSIMAALLVTGYSPDALRDIMVSVDYKRFCDKSLLDKVPVIGPVISLFKNKGYYGGDYFLGWIRELMEGSPSKATRFGDVKDERGIYRLNMIASDITRERMLLLPYGINDFCQSSDELEIALAVRMSMSIPIFFEPVNIVHPDGYKCHVVDGGLLSNFPVWLFDRTDGEPPRWPTFGFRLSDSQEKVPVNSIGGPIDLVKAVVTTMLNARDTSQALASDVVRTIDIDTWGNSGIDFGINAARKKWLLDSGRFAAKAFLSTWDFDQYVADFRQRN